jgi:hypothetical protein
VSRRLNFNKPGMFSRSLFLFLAFPLLARASLHGPLVQWSQNPSENAHLIWLERIGDSQRGKTADFRVEIHAGAVKSTVKATVGKLPGTPHRIIRANLEKLGANQLVKFRLVPEDGEAGKVFTFKTAPSAPSFLRFVTGGDLYHDRKRMDEMNRQAGLADPLFALIGGDLAYTNDNAPLKWFDYFDSWTVNARTPDDRLIPQIIVIGNHEVSDGGFNPTNAPGPQKAREFHALFEFPEKDRATYTLDFGHWLSLIILDSGHTRNVADQTAFLDSALSQRATVPHVFVCYHRPAYGVGAKPDCREIQQDWCPLFEKHRVTAVFENDHHQFIRSHPITAGKIDQENGIPYLGAGAWSVNTRPVQEAQLAKRPWIAKAAAVNHFYLIETNSRGFTATAIDLKGEAFDTYEREWKR